MADYSARATPSSGQSPHMGGMGMNRAPERLGQGNFRAASPTCLRCSSNEVSISPEIRLQRHGHHAEAGCSLSSYGATRAHPERDIDRMAWHMALIWSWALHWNCSHRAERRAAARNLIAAPIATWSTKISVRTTSQSSFRRVMSEPEGSSEAAGNCMSTAIVSPSPTFSLSAIPSFWQQAAAKLPDNRAVTADGGGD